MRAPLRVCLGRCCTQRETRERAGKSCTARKVRRACARNSRPARSRRVEIGSMGWALAIQHRNSEARKVPRASRQRPAPPSMAEVRRSRFENDGSICEKSTFEFQLDFFEPKLTLASTRAAMRASVRRGGQTALRSSNPRRRPDVRRGPRETAHRCWRAALAGGQRLGSPAPGARSARTQAELRRPMGGAPDSHPGRQTGETNPGRQTRGAVNLRTSTLLHRVRHPGRFEPCSSFAADSPASRPVSAGIAHTPPPQC